MRLVVQRVTAASVHIQQEEIARIGEGLLVLVGFSAEDGEHICQHADFENMIRKLVGLRIFPSPQDREGKLTNSVEEYGGNILLVPQFTLYADCRKGRRPSFSNAGNPCWAAEAYSTFVQRVDEATTCAVYSGKFGADMLVSLVNWGPVTILLDSKELFHHSAKKQKEPACTN